MVSRNRPDAEQYANQSADAIPSRGDGDQSRAGKKNARMPHGNRRALGSQGEQIKTGVKQER